MSKLRDQLVEAGRDEKPPEGSLERALRTVETQPLDAEPSDPKEAEPTPPSRRWIPWSLAAAAAVVGVVGFALLQSGQEPVQATPEPAATTPAPRVASAEPRPEPSAQPSALASASAEPSASAVAGGTRPPAKTTAGRPPPAAPPPPAKPASGPCGCNPNDLMCVMRCTKKK